MSTIVDQLKSSTATANERIQHARDMCEVGRAFHERNWSLATSSNYSVVLQQKPLELLVTASGKHKNRLTENDFVRVDHTGHPIDASGQRSSAETMLHVAIASQLPVGAVLHTHSAWGTVLSHRFFKQGGIELAGFEMLKGLEGVRTHEHSEWLPIFENTQDIPRLAEKITNVLAESPEAMQHGFLIHRHGLYTWGADLEEARRHVETIEFLLECLGKELMLGAADRFPRDHLSSEDVSSALNTKRTG